MMSFVKQEHSEYHTDKKSVATSNSDDGSQLEHNNQTSQTPITAFLAKLWALVNDPTCDDLICWDQSGTSFHVYDQSRFSREILPRYFKHNNFASFIRQLNMYGFRKISTIEHGSLRNEREYIEFAHPSFIRGHESLLELIKRRAPDNQVKPHTQTAHNSSALVSTNYADSKSARPVEFIRLLDDVRTLQNKQTSLNDKLSYLETENEALWNEISSLRQKHGRQQQIVTKLVEFLMSFITGSTGNSHKQSNERRIATKSIAKDFLQQELAQDVDQHENMSMVLGDRRLLTSNLKRKQPAITHSEEPNKRIAIEGPLLSATSLTSRISQQNQQPTQKVEFNPTDFPRQQSITINELADNDLTGWLNAADEPPLVDLVPSPQPPPVLSQMKDDRFDEANNLLWSSTDNQLVNPIENDNKNFQHITNASNNDKNLVNTFVPDFYLLADNTDGNKANINQIGNTNALVTKPLTGNSQCQPVLLKEEQVECGNTSYSQQPVTQLQQTATLFPLSEMETIPHQPATQLSFSLDDITGDVDHIQSSLDNIRDLMFDTLPDGTSIIDLFNEDNVLLSPLLPSSNNDQIENNLLDDIQQHQMTRDEKLPEQIDKKLNTSSASNVNNQLLEQLITESAIVEEQRNTINQLMREKNDLQDKINLLEKKTTYTK